MRRIPLITYGLQRTCTNLVKRALVDQAGCYEANGEHGGLAWKHSLIDPTLIVRPLDGHQARLLLCVREPRDWLRSCYQYFKHNKGADRTVCQHFRRDWTFSRFIHSGSYQFVTPMARWNEHTRTSYRVITDWAAEGLPAAVVRAEDLQTAAGQVREYERLVDVLGLDPDKSLRAIEHRVNNRGRVTTKRFDREEYIRRAASEWTAELRRWAEERIDWDLAVVFGYAQ